MPRTTRCPDGPARDTSWSRERHAFTAPFDPALNVGGSDGDGAAPFPTPLIRVIVVLIPFLGSHVEDFVELDGDEYALGVIDERLIRAHLPLPNPITKFKLSAISPHFRPFEAGIIPTHFSLSIWHNFPFEAPR